ncbi:hypothetical protein BE20_13450 [Sorangium cellulosum]|uniref:Uncharacterized protein n=1 Tax=Sorangium cellulosum TaxID=56 RepID=A0A150SHB3_SORCE|nr:hypothetical protein BE18_13785 [Sorangium cellulosum]KYF91863.1 hypothetical protein BE20_13450 [Sorangium cellulosum]
MPLVPSQILVGNLESYPAALGCFVAFGDRDDPMRLTVLMAQYVAGLWPHDREIQEKTGTCLDPRAPWRTRLRALGDALILAVARWKVEGPLFTLVDIDALVPQGEEPWTGDRALEMREDLFKILGHSIEQGGWLVLRTCPSKKATAEISKIDADVVPASAPSGEDPVDEVQLFAPEVRPVARWLLKEAGFRPRDLSRIVEQVKDPDAHLVDLAYQGLSSVACDAGKLLASLRPPQHHNGSIGPFAYANQSPGAMTLPRDAVEELREAGFLQPGGEPSTLRMPRLMREILRGFALLSMPGAVNALHRRLGARPIEGEPVAEQIEIHHHAVQAGDVALAKRTARFYGTELSDLARQLSIEAHREADRHSKAAKFKKAAELFDYVVSQFDKTDAYAWEYLGFNLARAHDASQNDRILDAYEKAHTLWRDNPLYHGRLLGFRGKLGEWVAPEIMRWLDHYVSQYGDEREAVSYFAEAALAGLRRGGQRAQLDTVLSRKRSILERFAPRALSRVEDEE